MNSPWILKSFSRLSCQEEFAMGEVLQCGCYTYTDTYIDTLALNREALGSRRSRGKVLPVFSWEI
jgi:hypothetical protein